MNFLSGYITMDCNGCGRTLSTEEKPVHDVICIHHTYKKCFGEEISPCVMRGVELMSEGLSLQFLTEGQKITKKEILKRLIKRIKYFNEPDYLIILNRIIKDARDEFGVHELRVIISELTQLTPMTIECVMVVSRICRQRLKEIMAK